MSTPRLGPVLLLLLSACAGWDSSTPSYSQPPVEEPVPSHYAPSPPDVPEPPEPPAPPAAPGDHVAIASVQLLGDCPDPTPASGIAGPPGEGSAGARGGASAGKPTEGWCSQSTAQLAVRSDRPGLLRIEAVRVLDAATRKVAGTSTLRQPTRWSADLGAYAPWDGRVLAGTELQTSYKLGVLDLSRSARLVGPDFDANFGPFILEVDVSIDRRRQTVRSPEFGRIDTHMMVT